MIPSGLRGQWSVPLGQIPGHMRNSPVAKSQIFSEKNQISEIVIHHGGKGGTSAEGYSSIEQSFESGGIISSTVQDKINLNSVISGKQISENIFIDRYTVPSFHKMKMCKAAKHSLTIDNAGGKSALSEALSMQYFRERFRARKYIPEMEIKYWIDYKMCDFICNIKGNRVGVSVSRAMGFPTPSDFTHEIAYRLLQKKMHGLVIASRGVCEKQEFHTSVLHIFCQDQRIADIVYQMYPRILAEDDTDTIRDVIMILTVCEQDYVYSNNVGKNE